MKKVILLFKIAVTSDLNPKNTSTGSVPSINEDNKSDSETVCTSFAVKKLIEIRQEMDSLFEKPNCKKVKLWGDVCLKMKKEGINIGAVECDRKWRNLILTYRRRKDQMRKSGSGRLPFWEFHEDFDHFFGLKANVSPFSETLLASTVPSNFKH
ncbi:uncharacterized protein [Centruroides vittatus]|uniref:uncharacterized protein n=1 Tax=Centruroides vittatus TaxID=120091 RepID=UPI003510B245